VAQPTAPRRPGVVRRFLRGLWEFTVTVVVMALFVGAWGVAVSGVIDGEQNRVLLGTAATVLFTPMAIHRITGRRGRYAFGVIGSVLATLGAVRLVGSDEDPFIILAAVFGLQVMASFFMSWLTRRRPREEPQPAA
ncbi:MAG TPA: hypothetical protein VFX98_05525, partial [Longimicrobiaceae bacterium]|nr:hypothetical protein [Longimicrobiaceae bacterium]